VDTRSRLHRIAAVLADRELHDLATNDIYWDKVVKVISVGHCDICEIVMSDANPLVMQGVLLHPAGM
jgi:hypothetical protein